MYASGSLREDSTRLEIVMSKRRAVIVFATGGVCTASGSTAMPYDLDLTLQKGGEIIETKEIGNGNALLLLVEENEKST